MGGTKIVVFQLKEIIKKMIYLCVGLIIVALLILLFLPKNKQAPEQPAALYRPGTYYAEIILHNNPVRVAVTVSEDAITAIDLRDMGETQAVFYPLFQPAMENISKEIVNSQDINAIGASDFAYTEEILIKAIRAAIDKAESSA